VKNINPEAQQLLATHESSNFAIADPTGSASLS